ncbi:hypothetical protein [Actinoplanes regularis]|uniref:hypothetical protein n=1 Tax=Actinoplanes regularis TaxID=52697 RepID=UPI0024A18FBB|nr:hypothetical protein [Actinoplanes regularis]GLW32269.1 hypothetical protein Areg01_52080 [Actinoplanes regularis]
MRTTLYSQILTRPSLSVASRTNGTVNGSTVDKADPSGGYDGFTAALLVVVAGTITDGTHTVTVQDSDDGSAWAAADTAFVQGGPVALTSANSNTVAELGYTGPKRYVRASVVTSGATTGGTLGAVVVLGGQTSLPVKR